MRTTIPLSFLLVFASVGAHSQVSRAFSTTQVHMDGHFGVYRTTEFSSAHLVTSRRNPNSIVYFTDGSPIPESPIKTHVDEYSENKEMQDFYFR